jgi:hypothetical protein
LGNEALAEELERMMPLLRQCEEKIREEGSFGKILASWMRPLEKNASLKERVLTASLKAQYGTQDYFTQVITSFSDSLMADVKMFDRIAKMIEKFLADKKIVGTQKGIDFGALILKASQSGNEEVFRQLSRLQRMIHNENRKGDSYPEKDFGGVLLSVDGTLRTSSTSRWETPAFYPYALDSLPWKENAFHTDKEKSPWAEVVLPGVCDVMGVVVENKTPSDYYRSRQYPIEILVSEDGKNYETILTDSTKRDTYRVSVKNKPRKAKYIKVRRTPDAKDDVFHLNKILVYGKRLY